jgi:hypothetical protein
VANAGGALDGLLSTVGVIVFVAAAFFLATALRRTPGWKGWAAPAGLVGVVFLVLIVVLIANPFGFGGLWERLLAAFGAAAIGALAWRISTTSEPRHVV